MKLRKLLHFISLFFISALVLFQTTGCKKEYSYEARNPVPVRRDTVITPPAFTFPVCALCKVNDSLLEDRWNFKTGSSYLCGAITDGIITSDKNAFTFFGPSACSVDTGLVITAYLDPVKLNADQFNITTNKVAFYYYDHHATSYIFISLATINFSLTIESFIYATGIATGTFSGGVYKANGQTVFINEGRFKVKLR